MLNYIWGGLIVFSLVFALTNDASDIINDTWQNGEEFGVEILFPANADLNRNQNVRFSIDGGEQLFSARWYPVDEEAELIIAVQDGLPQHWLAVAENQSSSRKQEIRAYVAGFALQDGTELEELLDTDAQGSADGSDRSVTDLQHGVGADEGIEAELDAAVLDSATGDGVSGDGSASRNGVSGGANGGVGGSSGATNGVAISGFTANASLVLPEVHFVKLRAITAAAFDMAEFAVTLALGLVGIMALWLGLMKIAEEAGLIHVVVKGVRPFMRWLFPELPKDHPAMGMISLNLAANVLGLGNAATPLGIKAMEELQKLNPEKDTATNSMIMFLALNTSSVQLLPPVTLVAIMGMRVNELMVAITLTTIFSTIAAIIAAKLYARKYPPVVSASGEILAVGIDSDGAAALRSGSGDRSSSSGSVSKGSSQGSGSARVAGRSDSSRDSGSAGAAGRSDSSRDSGSTGSPKNGSGGNSSPSDSSSNRNSKND